MRKTLFILLSVVFAVNMFGCATNDVAGNHEDNFSTNSTMPKESFNDDQGQYDQNKIMFLTWDRYDIEGDRDIRYCYNYKGDLIDNSGSVITSGILSETAPLPATDPSSEMIGYIDKEGVFVIAPQYEDASIFSDDGVAVVCADDLWGAIDTTGAQIIPCQYAYLSSFFESGYAVFGVKDEEWVMHYGILDSKGNIVAEDINDINGSVYVFDGYYCTIPARNTARVINRPYFVNEQAIYDFSGRLIERTEHRIKDPNNENLFFTQFYMVNDNVLYRYTVQMHNSFYLGNVVEIAQYNGTQFVEVKKEYEISYKQVATAGTGYGYGLTVSGETVIPFKYDQIHPIGDYFACVVWNSTTNTQVLDIYNSEYELTASNLQYSIDQPWGLMQTLPNGYFYVYRNLGEDQLDGIIDYKGNIIVELQFFRGIKYCDYAHLANYRWN